MSKPILDADDILQHASPLLQQKGHEIQPFGRGKRDDLPGC